MVLNATLLSTQHYKARINGKLEQSREISSGLRYTLVEPSTKVANFTFFTYIYIYIYMCVCVCVCVCVSVCAHINVHTHIYIYICWEIYRERLSERERGGVREREREAVSEKEKKAKVKSCMDDKCLNKNKALMPASSWIWKRKIRVVVTSVSFSFLLLKKILCEFKTHASKRSL